MFKWLKLKSNVVEPQKTLVVEEQKPRVNFADWGAIAAYDSENKDFDWLNYQALSSGGQNSMFMGEFNLIPTIRAMKQLHMQEFWINANTNAVSKQFLSSRMILKMATGEDVQVVHDHPLLTFLKTAGQEVENAAFMNSNTIADMNLTGNAYWYISKDLKTRRRIPAERVDPQINNNQVLSYRIIDRGELSNLPDNAGVNLTPEEIVHFKYPNPFSPYMGLSPFIASILPTLIDKYGREYVLGFLLRGGNTAGIIETDTSNMEQLIRLSKSIMQAFGGRKNMHADKILPKGASWKGQGSNFGEMRLTELLKENVSLFKAAGGTNNAALGLGDQSNRATAYAEMEFFWRNTIQPIQFMFVQAIVASSLWSRFGLDSRWTLEFDNSHIPYLDDFDRRIDQDKALTVLTVNERRERLGYDPLNSDYDVLESQIQKFSMAPQAFSLPETEQKAVQEEVFVPLDALTHWKKEELDLQSPPEKVHSLFKSEFSAWEDIVIGNLENKRSALKKVKSRGTSFAKKFAEKALEPAMQAYGNQIKGVKTQKSFKAKESNQDRQAKLDLLQERAKDIVRFNIMKKQKDRFLGYSETAMNSIYDFIAVELDGGASLPDVAAAVRMKFNTSYGLEEAYPGQALTIVNTEFGSAMAIGQAQFGDDLASVTKEMTKTWISMGDDGHTRDSHLELDGFDITGDSDGVMDELFNNNLRYPKDPIGEAKEVINCRCTIQYSPVTWND